MAQTNFTPISLYYSTTAAAVPTAGNLVAGELAINTQDGKLFYKDAAGVVQTLASKDANSGTFVNLAYTGTLTGGTGVVNLGSGQFYKDASGNVGIGTASPSSLGGTTLQVQNSTIGAILWSDGTRIGELLASTAANISVGSRSNHALQLVTNDTERMRITSTGIVDIGGSSGGSVGELLVVEGANSAGHRAARINNTGTTNGYSTLWMGSSNDGLIRGGSTAGSFTDQLLLLTSGAIPISFYTANTERMRINGSGNVGIGTSSPSLPLQITAGNKSGFNISYDNSGALRTGLFMWTAGGSDGSIGGGVEQTADNVYTARSTVASYIRFNNGETRFFNDSSLTAGNTYTPTERMRITSSGYVGIGTTAPETKLQVEGTADTVGATFRITSSGVASAGLACNGTGLFFAIDTGGFIWKTGTQNLPTTAGTERMRMSSGGSFYINQSAGNGNTPQKMGLTYDGSSEWGLSFQNSWSGNGGSAVNFNNFAGTQVGTIQAGASSTSYVTTSDYRLKENIAPMTGALAKVSALKPCTYTWKSTGAASQGFIAHELQEVCPDAVSGEKDAVNKDGSIKPQGIDTSFLVATLAAAIQEQQALIENLTTRLNALEGK
jgi:hypothetical protein